MAKKPPEGTQIDTINRNSPFVQMSFDLKRLDGFVQSLGVDFKHFKAMPSPLGKKDRGDHRRSDGVDTVTSNGMIYRCGGTFTATITDNSREVRRGDAAPLDPSEARLVLPRFYKDGTRIRLAPGDRLYISDPDADVLVSNYQEMDYMDGPNVPMYPIVEFDGPVTDSQGVEYVLGADYKIDRNGDIVWVAGGRNPGIDPDTGKGRIYSIRYMYRAYWYVTAIPKEIRITNVTTGNERTPERMPMHAIIVREFIFHNRNRGEAQNQNKPATQERTVSAPVESITPDKYVIPVDMSAFGDDGEQS